MGSILYLCFEFILRLLRVLYPTLWIIIPFVWLRRKSLARGKALDFMLLFLLFELGGRIFVYFSGVRYQYRYLYPFVVAVAIFAGVGIDEFVIRFEQMLKRLSWFKPGWMTSKHVFYLALFGIIAATVPKALRPQRSKLYIHDVPRTITEHCPEGKKPIIVAGFLKGEARLSYYADAEFLSLEKMTNLLKNTTVSVSDPNGESEQLTNLQSDLDQSLLLPIHSRKKFQLEFMFPDKEPCHRRIGFLEMPSILADKGKIRVEAITEGRTTPGPKHVKGQLREPGWQTLYQGRLTDQIKLYRIRNVKKFRLSFELEKPVEQLAMNLTRYPLWTILRKDSDLENTDWFPISKTRSLTQLNRSFATLGKRNVFMLLPGKADQWTQMFQSRGVAVDLVKIRDFAIEKKSGTIDFTLLQYSPRKRSAVDE